MIRDQVLEELKQSLHGLLSLLDGQQPSAEALLRAVAECDERVAALRAAPIPEDESPAQQADFTSSLEEALRLNTVARSVVESQGVELIERLEKARDLRKGLAGSQSQTGDAGRSVDIAG